jgi:anti-sigma factor ChrR (cupin superfamily)
MADEPRSDVYIAADQLPWVAFSPGIAFKLLRASAETGEWTAVFRCEAGSSFAAHRHLGAGEYLMLEGRMEVRGGAAAGGVTAAAGDYGYEPNGIVHDSTCFPVETRFYFTHRGPVAFLDAAGRVTDILDWRLLREIQAKGQSGGS